MRLSIVLDTSHPQRDGKCALKIRISQKGECVHIPMNMSLLPSQFDGGLPLPTRLRKLAEDTFIDYRVKLRDIDDRISRMSAVQIKDYLTSDRAKNSPLLVDAVEAYATTCRAPKTAKGYRYAAAKVREFSQGAPLVFEDVDHRWLSNFDNWLESGGLGTNGRSVVMRCLRVVFNHAIENEQTDTYPFKKFKIRSSAKVKEHLTVDQFRMIRDADFGNDNDARDFFLLSFYAIGINPIDLYWLDGLPGGRLRYVRRKTSKFYDIGVQPEFAEICARFKGDAHLLNFADRYRNYDTFINFYRKKLRRIGKAICVPDITFYWARYTWATLAYEIGVPRDSISQSLGHSFAGPAVTSVYIDYDYKKVDEANRRVLDYVK